MSIADEFNSKVKKEIVRDKITNVAPLIVLILLYLIFTFTCWGSFATVSNTVALLNQLATPLLVATGLTFVIMLGSIDLSIDGVVGMSASIFSVLVLNTTTAYDLSGWAVLIAVACCVVCGLMVGSIHVALKIPSFMVSLGVMYIAKGVGILAYSGKPATITDPFFLSIPTAKFLGLPIITWISLILFGVAFLIQNYTAFGRNIYAIGANEGVARAAGININWQKIKVFLFAGLCFGIAGVVGAVRLAQGQINIGDGMTFPACAAVVVGGTSLSGGKGGVVNSLVGAAIMTVLENGLVMWGVNAYIKDGVEGLIILVAVALSVSRSRRIVCK